MTRNIVLLTFIIILYSVQNSHKMLSFSTRLSLVVANNYSSVVHPKKTMYRHNKKPSSANNLCASFYHTSGTQVLNLSSNSVLYLKFSSFCFSCLFFFFSSSFFFVFFFFHLLLLQTRTLNSASLPLSQDHGCGSSVNTPKHVP